MIIEQRYMPGDTDFRRALRIIDEAGVEGIVLWGDATAAGTILKQMREMGMKQRVFGSFRVLGDDLRLVVRAAEASGPNRERPRDALAANPFGPGR